MSAPNGDSIELLSTFELHELVYWTLSLLNVPVGALERDDSAIAASYAVQKVGYYTAALGQIEGRRRELGLQTRRELAEAEERRADDPAEAARLRQEALHTGDYEIQQHFFTVCAAQIGRLLRLAHRLVGVPFPPDAEAFFASYQPLRNQFEHLNERLPSEERGGRLVLDAPGRLLLGLNDDGAGNITVRRAGVNVVAQVNARGVAEAERLVARSLADIRAKCIEHLEQFFADHPELAADAGWIQPMVVQRLREADGEYDQK